MNAGGHGSLPDKGEREANHDVETFGSQTPPDSRAIEKGHERG